MSVTKVERTVIPTRPLIMDLWTVMAILFFKAPLLEKMEKDERMDVDALITLPAIDAPPNKDALQEKIVTVKRLLSDEAAVIELHDFVIQEVREFLASTGEDRLAKSMG